MRVEVKVRGAGRVQHRCSICDQPINGDPLFLHREGRLVAVHADCHQKEN